MARKAPIWVGIAIAVVVVGFVIWQAASGISRRAVVVDGQRIILVTGPFGSQEALLEGTLTLSEGGCLTVEETVVVWPDGFNVGQREGDIVVRDRDGVVIGTVGEPIALSGGGGASQEFRRLPLAECPGSYWWTSGIVTASP